MRGISFTTRRTDVKKHLRIVSLLLLALLAPRDIAATPPTSNSPGLNSRGVITPGDCAEWFNGYTLEDAGSPCGSGGGGLPSIAAYSTLSNNTGSTAQPSATQQFILGSPGYVASGYNFAQWTATANSYAQISLQNLSTGSSASSDFVATANDGNDTTHYVDLGVNNSNGGGAAFTNAHAGYFYAVDNELDIGALGASGADCFYTTGGTAAPVQAGCFTSTQTLTLAHALAGTYGGTGVNNGANTITLGGNFTTSGANPVTLTTTGSTNVTLPTSGTLSTTTGTVTSIATTAPITGGTITGTGTIACATCATTTNGGALSGTAPIAVSASGVISGGGLGSVTGALKGNGSGTITQAACADLSNGATGCSTATGTSGATIPLNNGGNTFSGTNVQSGTYSVTATTTPTQASGTLGLAGTATKPTLGATSEGDIFLTAVGGLNIIGDGSSFDWQLWNKSGTSVCTVATGSTNLNCTGLQVGGTGVALAGTLTNTDWCTSNGTLVSCNTAAPVTSFTGDGVIINNSASTGAVTDTLVNAGANSVLGNDTGSGTAPAYQTTVNVKLVETINNAISVTSNAGTASASFGLNTFTNSSAATMTITLPTSSIQDGQMMIVRVYDFSAVAETISWVNTENSTVSAPTTSNGSTTLPLTVGFMWNASTSKWRCIASA